MRNRLPEYNPTHLPLILIAITVFALLIRLVFLGHRTAHWDEARVGYDILRFMATGQWEYRPIIHGPFLPQINKHIFTLIGPSDFSARLIIAITGGLFPMATWLYRDYLSPGEVITVAGFIALDPLFLYYSRFMRNDLLLAAFVFIALGFSLRHISTNQPRYLYGATVFTGLAFTTKGNVILYVLCIIGAAALLLDHRLFLARTTDMNWTTISSRYAKTIGTHLWNNRRHLLINTILFIAIITYFYAPRGGAVNGLDLWTSITSPQTFPDLLYTATIGSAHKLIDLWILGGIQDHSYISYFVHYIYILGNASAAIVLLAIFGFITDRYDGTQPRDIIALGFYWGIASIIGYPIAVDIRAPWNVIHALLPLFIPAAAGLLIIANWARDALRDDDRVSTALAGIVIALVLIQIVGVGFTATYTSPQDDENFLVQYGQPGDNMHPAIQSIDTAAANNEGTDVLWYGPFFFMTNETAAQHPPVRDGNWYHRLPLPWYLEMSNAETASTAGVFETIDRYEADQPPVIITCTGNDKCPSPEEIDQVEDALDGYKEYRYLGRSADLSFIFYIDETYTEDTDP